MNKKEGKRDGCTRATWVDSVQLWNEKEAIWKCALLNHRLTYRIAVGWVHPIPHSMKSISLHFPCQLFFMYSIVSICSCFSLCFTISLSIFLSFSSSLCYTKPTVFFLLQISTQTSLMQCNIARAEIKRAATDLSISTKF